MLFSSLPFLFYFLPAVLLIYFLTPRRGKNAVLLLSSLLFYGWGEPRYVFLMLATIAAFYFSGRVIAGCKTERNKKITLIAAVSMGLILLGIFKYADFFIDSVNSVTGLGIPFLRIALPIGISFYTFQCISYAVDVYRGTVLPQRSIINFGAYVALFPQLIAGPIVRYKDIARELDNREHILQDFAAGLSRFSIGLGKKVLLANRFGELTALYRGTQNPSVLFCWIYAVSYMLQIYFDFSGYSDMAIGLGRVFGFHFTENFNYPYLSRSITEFWRRWHISLGSWFRDYVYIPMGGNRVSKPRWFLNILTVWMFTGLWHGANWNFVLWGLLFAMFLLLEKQTGIVEKMPGFLQHLYVLLTVCLSFVLFNGSDLSEVGADLAGMFGAAGLPAVSAEAIYCLRSFLVLLVLGAIGATPIPKRIAEKVNVSRYSAAATAIEWLLMAAMLLLCTACLVDSSFNPFLYFRF